MADTVSVERVIRGEADQLWAMVADVTRMPEWSPETVSATWLDRAGPARVGARFEGTNRHGRKTWKTLCTVTASEQGRVFAFRVKVGPLPIAETFPSRTSIHPFSMIPSGPDVQIVAFVSSTVCG